MFLNSQNTFFDPSTCLSRVPYRSFMRWHDIPRWHLRVSGIHMLVKKIKREERDDKWMFLILKNKWKRRGEKYVLIFFLFVTDIYGFYRHVGVIMAYHTAHGACWSPFGPIWYRRQVEDPKNIFWEFRDPGDTPAQVYRPPVHFTKKKRQSSWWFDII